MTDSNDTRTKEQLLAEIEALKHQLAARGSDADKPISSGSSEPIFSVPITRRQAVGHALASWVAPVILSVPVVAVVAALKPGTAYAKAVPSLQPVRAPTVAATVAPTVAATVAPTAVPIPGPGLVSLAALGSALAAGGSKLLTDRMGTSDVGGSKNGGGSQNDSGTK